MEILEGRTAVVTGAASGIGLAVTEAFVAEGMRVAMLDRNDDALQSHAGRLADDGAEVHAVHADVRDAAQLESIGRSIVDRFGGLHVAVNNAGIVNRGTTWELSIDDWKHVLDVNLWGVINGVHAFVPLILATGEEGHVVNTASLAALLPLQRLGPYTVAKHGVLGLSDVLRVDLVAAGAPVGVSVVMPGLIKTGMNPIGTVPAAAVAANVLDAIRRNRLYVYTDDHATAGVESRLRELIDARAQVVDETGAPRTS